MAESFKDVFVNNFIDLNLIPDLIDTIQSDFPTKINSQLLKDLNILPEDNKKSCYSWIWKII
jgi:hypothetical protein